MTACSFPLNWDLDAWKTAITRRDRVKLPGVAAFHGQDYVPSMDTFWNATPESPHGFRSPDPPTSRTYTGSTHTPSSPMSENSARKRPSNASDIDEDLVREEFGPNGGISTQLNNMKTPKPSGIVARDDRPSPFDNIVPPLILKKPKVTAVTPSPAKKSKPSVTASPAKSKSKGATTAPVSPVKRKPGRPAKEKRPNIDD